ncbi:MAG: hypothetical protein HYV52_03920, partial [Parcubacteria group bacterium]|nr:hypothetical protein [Parcubacteria group bacterium]
MGHGSIGSPYENWAEQWNRNNTNLLQTLNNENSLNFNTLGEYFDYIANYSNHNFFSEGTIFDRRYQNPVAVNRDENYGYGLEPLTNQSFHLFKFIDQTSGILNKQIRQTTTLNDNLILTDYWRLLSKQAILTGAGVVHLFQEQAETAYQQKLQSNIQASFFQKMFSAGQESIQLTGEWLTDKVKNTGNIAISLSQSGYYYIFLPTKDKAVDDYNQRFHSTNNSNLNLAATVFNLNQPTDVPLIPELNQPTQPIPTPSFPDNTSPPQNNNPIVDLETAAASPETPSNTSISQNSSSENPTVANSSQLISQELPWWQTLGYSSAGSAPGSPNPPEVSLASEPEITPLDTTPPILPDTTPPVSPSIASPLNNQTFNVFNLDTDFSVTIIGQTEPNSEVLIATELVCLELTSCNPVIPDQNGNWQ